ncbi:hypothetical protein [Lichenihabitans psoromatis]|uniref:hypothetical protein n=1 Tax=Lichenihabitans psoromatis TaxID=2528642 RepID=UPI0010383B71|nr:hypothetical protein [Lichenihabitans psoromatis]
MPATKPFDPHGLSVIQLLGVYASILDELRARGAIRSSNNPLSDYAERLFCRAFGWTLNTNSTTGYDAADQRGTRFEIKARRLTRHNGSRQLSAIRNLEARHFDHLAAVLMNEDFSILLAAIIPHEVVVARASFVKHTNSSKFMLVDQVWQCDGVRDVTAAMRDAVAAAG